MNPLEVLLGERFPDKLKEPDPCRVIISNNLPSEIIQRNGSSICRNRYWEENIKFPMLINVNVMCLNS